jgi:hypothetical protein
VYAVLRRLVVFALALSSVGAVVTQPLAQAAARVVYVDVSVASTWTAPIRDAVSWVDYFAGSDMVLGACRSGAKCIIIRERLIYSSWAEYSTWQHTYYVATDRAHIWLNPQRRSYPDWLQRRIVAHGLGHANGITWHNIHWCSGIMNGYLSCGGGLYPPWRFTSPQRDRLRIN